MPLVFVFLFHFVFRIITTIINSIEFFLIFHMQNMTAPFTHHRREMHVC